MKLDWKAAALCAVVASASATGAAAQSISYIYSYQTPLLNIQAGLQIGRTADIAAVQTSASNVFSVTQIAPAARALVYQQGVHSIANIVQIGGPLPHYWLGSAP